MSSPCEMWTKLLDRSLASRLDPETFTTFVTLLHQKSPLPPRRICDIFLSPRPENNYCLDPNASRYILSMLILGFVNTPAILHTLWCTSTFRSLAGEEAESKKIIQRWTNSFSAEETLFYRLTRAIASGGAPKTLKEAVEIVLACIQWMKGIMTANHGHHNLPMLSPSQTAEIHAQNMALGTFIVSVVENTQIQAAIAKGRVGKEDRTMFGKALAGFVPLILLISPQNAARLEVFRTETMVGIEPAQKRSVAGSSGVDKEIDAILEEGLSGGLVVESMVLSEMVEVNSRCGLYIYLNALLVGRPLIDDDAIFAYLHNRYHGDIRSTIVDLILAAFDVLANANFRNEKPQTTSLLRSFLTNKIPLLLSTLSSQLYHPLTSEFCITEALSHVDTTAFPTLATMFDDTNGNNEFPDSVRQDFCFACCLHGLIAETSMEDLLGDVPMQSLPAGGRYVKEDLVQQCISDPERAEALIDELENMDGNVGAVSQAISEVIARLCSNKETMSLKTLCSQLARKPSSLDVMLLFTKPTSILQPICDLLDNWRYDEDQGEYQPVYEEFGSILLLLLTCNHRYNLSPISLGARGPNSFVLKLLYTAQTPFSQSSPPATQTHLSSWILGLFAPENSGLTDDLMSSCPPQDFYLLLPSLFHNIVLAYTTHALPAESLKSGLEYLTDLFLLPSLISGINFLSSHLWESRGDKDAVLQILAALITTPLANNNNSEASQHLDVVLNIVAKDLERSLRWLQRAEPSRQDIEPLSKALRGHLGWERRGTSEHTELESWTSTPGGGLSVSLKLTVANLVHWGLNPNLNVNPANYTHRQILVGTKMIGAKRVLGTVIEELKTQIDAGNGGVALDIATAIVCAPEGASWDSTFGTSGADIQPLQCRINLREALKNEAEKAPKLHRTDPFTAETIVRLFRRVEAQLAIPEHTHIMTGDGMEGIEGMGAMTSMEIGAMGGLEMGGMSGIDGMGGIGSMGDMNSMNNIVGGESVDLMMQGDFMGSGAAASGDLLDGLGF